MPKKKTIKRAQVPAHIMAEAYPSGSDESGSDDEPAPKTLSIASGVGRSMKVASRREKHMDEHDDEKDRDDEKHDVSGAKSEPAGDKAAANPTTTTKAPTASSSRGGGDGAAEAKGDVAGGGEDKGASVDAKSTDAKAAEPVAAKPKKKKSRKIKTVKPKEKFQPPPLPGGPSPSMISGSSEGEAHSSQTRRYSLPPSARSYHATRVAFPARITRPRPQPLATPPPPPAMDAMLKREKINRGSGSLTPGQRLSRLPPNKSGAAAPPAADVDSDDGGWDAKSDEEDAPIKFKAAPVHWDEETPEKPEATPNPTPKPKPKSNPSAPSTVQKHRLNQKAMVSELRGLMTEAGLSPAEKEAKDEGGAGAKAGAKGDDGDGDGGGDGEEGKEERGSISARMAQFESKAGIKHAPPSPGPGSRAPPEEAPTGPPSPVRAATGSVKDRAAMFGGTGSVKDRAAMFGGAAKVKSPKQRPGRQPPPSVMDSPETPVPPYKEASASPVPAYKESWNEGARTPEAPPQRSPVVPMTDGTTHTNATGESGVGGWTEAAGGPGTRTKGQWDAGAGQRDERKGDDEEPSDGAGPLFHRQKPAAGIPSLNMNKLGGGRPAAPPASTPTPCDEVAHPTPPLSAMTGTSGLTTLSPSPTHRTNQPQGQHQYQHQPPPPAGPPPTQPPGISPPPHYTNIQPTSSSTIDTQSPAITVGGLSVGGEAQTSAREALDFTSEGNGDEENVAPMAPSPAPALAPIPAPYAKPPLGFAPSPGFVPQAPPNVPTSALPPIKAPPPGPAHVRRMERQQQESPRRRVEIDPIEVEAPTPAAAQVPAQVELVGAQGRNEDVPGDGDEDYMGIPAATVSTLDKTALVHDVDRECIAATPKHSHGTPMRPHEWNMVDPGSGLALDEAVPTYGGGPLPAPERRWLVRPLSPHTGAVRAVVRRRGAGEFDMYLDSVGGVRFGSKGGPGGFVMGASRPKPGWKGYEAGKEGKGKLVLYLGRGNAANGSPVHTVASLKPCLAGSGYSLDFLGASGGCLASALYTQSSLGPKAPRAVTVCLPSSPYENEGQFGGEGRGSVDEHGMRRLFVWRDFAHDRYVGFGGHVGHHRALQPSLASTSDTNSLPSPLSSAQRMEAARAKQNKPKGGLRSSFASSSDHSVIQVPGMVTAMARGDFDDMLPLRSSPAAWMSIGGPDHADTMHMQPEGYGAGAYELPHRDFDYMGEGSGGLSTPGGGGVDDLVALDGKTGLDAAMVGESESSVKTVQLLAPRTATGRGNCVLQVSKPPASLWDSHGGFGYGGGSARDTFVVQFQAPLSPMQAFGIAITSITSSVKGAKVRVAPEDQEEEEAEEVEEDKMKTPGREGYDETPGETFGEGEDQYVEEEADNDGEEGVTGLVSPSPSKKSYNGWGWGNIPNRIQQAFSPGPKRDGEQDGDMAPLTPLGDEETGGEGGELEVEAEYVVDKHGRKRRKEHRNHRAGKEEAEKLAVMIQAGLLDVFQVLLPQVRRRIIDRGARPFLSAHLNLI